MRGPSDDVPGTVRASANGDIAIRTTDEDGAPWFHVTGDGQRYWATHGDVQDWPVRAASCDSAVELKWTRVPASRATLRKAYREISTPKITRITQWRR